MARISLKRTVIFIGIMSVCCVFAAGQKPAAITVEAERQPHSPIFLTILGVDSSTGSPHVITYSIQNVSKQNIQGYVVASSRGRSDTSYGRSFPPGKTVLMDTWEEEVNLRNDRNLRIFVDLVVFANGSSWGKDERRRLDDIRGFFAGQDTALARFRTDLAKVSDTDLVQWLANDKNGVDPIPAKPDADNAMWAKAYERGYRHAFSDLQRAFASGGIDAVREKLKP